MRITGLAVAALVAISTPNAAAAQRVFADIRIGPGPVSGHVVIGDRYHPRPRTVLVARSRPPVWREYHPVTVYRVYHRPGWYEHRGYHRVSVWYDAGYGRYYDSYNPHRPGLREVVIYEREGRYYDYDGRNADHRWNDRDGRHGDRD